MTVEIKISKEELFEFFRKRATEQGFNVADIREDVDYDGEFGDFMGIVIEVNSNLDKEKLLA